MSRLFIVKRKSVFIAGTALLGALVAVLDWMSKIGWFKVPFFIPQLGFLKFDTLGIPMLLSSMLFGFFSGTITSLIGWFSISFRNPFSGFMKFLAEFSTMLGVFIILRVRWRYDIKWKTLAIVSGVSVRVIVMALANILLLPLFTTTSAEFVIIWLPWISCFNAIQGVISAFGGFIVYEAIILRLPALGR